LWRNLDCQAATSSARKPLAPMSFDRENLITI